MILIMLGSSQDLNIMAQGGETTILLLLWTRSPRMNYSRITPEAGMVMKSPPVMISPPAGCREELQNPPELGLTTAAATELFVDNCSGI